MDSSYYFSIFVYKQSTIMKYKSVIPKRGEDASHRVWMTLLEQQYLVATPANVVNSWCDNFENYMVGQLRDVPEVHKLSVMGWSLVPVYGKLEDDIFFEMLSRSQFPVNIKLRHKDNLFYLEERDLFHDSYGHLPILNDPTFSNFLRALGTLYVHNMDNEDIKKKLQRFYWYTAEFGLVEEEGGVKAIGAGIISSKNELLDCLFSSQNKRIHYKNYTPQEFVDIIVSTEYVTNGFQNEYFVFPGIDNLFDYLLLTF